LLKSRAGLDLLHVPYRGIPQALTDLLGGRLDVVFADPSTGLGMLREGKLKALAVTSLKRMPALPDVPTIAESGYPGFEIVPWLALFVPAKTPQPVIEKLAAMLAGYHRDDASIKYMETIGAEAFPANNREVTSFLSET
jgi:tripartite-type tricarboxylate transporter receptor subunit TctC